MARTGAKAWITRRVPPDLERSLYVWIASVLFLAVCWLWQPLPGVIWETSGALFWILFAIQMIGVALTLRAAGIVGVWELAGVRQPDHTKPIDFKASGPFAIVRHPIYLGWVLIVFATPVMTTSRLLFAVISTAYLDRRDPAGRSGRSSRPSARSTAPINARCAGGCSRHLVTRPL